MVEFIDGSVLAQLSVTDMCFPDPIRGHLAGTGPQQPAAA